MGVLGINDFLIMFAAGIAAVTILGLLSNLSAGATGGV